MHGSYTCPPTYSGTESRPHMIAKPRGHGQLPQTGAIDIFSVLSNSFTHFSAVCLLTARFFVGGPLAEGSSAAGSRAHLCSDIAAVRHELWPYTCYNWPEIVRRLDVISTSDEWNMLILYQLNTLVIHLTNLRLDSFPSHIFLVALLVVFNISVLIHRKSR